MYFIFMLLSADCTPAAAPEGRNGIDCDTANDCAKAGGEICDKSNLTGGRTQGFCTCPASPSPTAGFCSCAATLQGIAPCACANPSDPVRCSGAGCVCGADGLGNFSPTLRLAARYAQNDQITYNICGDDDLVVYNVKNGADQRIPVANVRTAIRNATAQWSNVECCPGQVLHLAFREEAQLTDCRAPTDDATNLVGSGKPQTEVKKRVWSPGTLALLGPVESGGAPSAQLLGGPSSTVLAVTPTVNDNGTLLRSRMVINGAKYRWFVNDADLCSGCYDLRTVLTHEFGHFIGYQHSLCRQSIMYPEYAPGIGGHTLNVADKEAFCGIKSGQFPSLNTSYSPMSCPGYVTPTSPNGTPTAPAMVDPTKAQRGQSCASDSACQLPYKCASGSCDLPCAQNNDCPASEICDHQIAGKTYCRIGGATSIGATGTPAIAADFCAPCETHADCSTGVCVQVAAGSQLCSGYCRNDADCGPSGTCTAASSGEGVCIPKDTSCIQKVSAALGQVNEACSASVPCGPNLQCVQLINASVCLEKCDTKPNGRQCSSQGYGCYEIDRANQAGVCFKSVMREGESCLLPDTALCGFADGLACYFTDNTGTQSACYKLCGGQYGATCAQGQDCKTNPGETVGACQPLLPACAEGMGVACAKPQECDTGVCASIRNQQVCTRACDPGAQTGCPNGFRCDAVPGGQGGFCYPSDGVAKPATCVKPKTGCGCHGSENPGDLILVLLSILFVLRFSLRRTWPALAIVLFSLPADATTVLDMDGPQLAAASDAVVHARVLSVKGRVTPQARVYTDVELEVIEGLKGAQKGARIHVSYPGGRTEALGMHVSGQVSMTANTECIIYLNKGAENVFVPAAMRLGFYEVQKRAYDGVREAVRTTDGLELLRRKAQNLEPASPRASRVTLSDALAEIRNDLAVVRK